MQDAKRSRRKRRELKKKAKIRLAEAAAVAGLGEEQDLGEEALFSLDIIKGSKALQSTGVPCFVLTLVSAYTYRPDRYVALRSSLLRFKSSQPAAANGTETQSMQAAVCFVSLALELFCQTYFDT